MPLARPGFDSKLLGLKWLAPSGFGASCDAGILSREGHPVLTYGPGRLNEAHSLNEFVALDHLFEAIAVSTLTAIALAT